MRARLVPLVQNRWAGRLVQNRCVQGWFKIDAFGWFLLVVPSEAGSKSMPARLVFALVLQAKSKSSFNFHGSVPLSLVA
jgi:hypothetical protein